MGQFIGGITWSVMTNASVAEKSTWQPDNNPLDCRPDGFGSGGHGVAARRLWCDGERYDLPWRLQEFPTEEQLKGMSIGPYCPMPDFGDSCVRAATAIGGDEGA